MPQRLAALTLILCLIAMPAIADDKEVPKVAENGQLGKRCSFPTWSRLVTPKSVLNDPSFSSEKVRLVFHVMPNGEVRDIEVVEKSRYPALDEISLYKLGRLDCEPVPPSLLNPQGQWLTIEMNYKR